MVYLSESDVYAAVFDLLQEYCPDIPSDAIYRGWGNRASLPSLSEEYAVISILGHYRRGTNVETLEVDEDTEEGSTVIEELVECDVQIDFCSEDDSARRRAQVIETVARSSVGVSFFKSYDIGCCYASDVLDISFVGDSDQHVRRCMTTLRLTYKTGVSVSQEYFDSVSVGIKNVDVFYPPKGDD